MIRFLQAKDNRITKAFFVVIIAAASVGMVVYLIPGLTGMGVSAADTYAMIYPHWYSRFFSSGVTVSQERVSQMARRQVQQRNPQYADNPMILRYFEQQVGQQLVQQQILLAEADKLGITATDDDVSPVPAPGPVWRVPLSQRPVHRHRPLHRLHHQPVQHAGRGV